MNVAGEELELVARGAGITPEVGLGEVDEDGTQGGEPEDGRGNRQRRCHSRTNQRALNTGHSAITRLTPTQTGLQRPGQFCLFMYLYVCSVINLIKYLFQNRSSFRQLSYSRVASV